MDNSPLSTIPPELRTYIYEFCLVSHPDPIIIAPSQPSISALLKTCRQIRKECESLYYASNTFLLTLPEKPFKTTHFFAEWLSSIGTENSKVLKDVIIEITSKAMKWGVHIEGGSWVYKEIGRIRDLGMKVKVRLSCLSDDYRTEKSQRKHLDLDLKALGESLKKQIKAVKRLLREEEDVDEYMYLSYAKSRLERLLELEEPEVISKRERKRREDMKRALGIPV